jgi:hypothetical protein
MGVLKLPARDFPADPLLQNVHSFGLPKRIRPLYSYFNKCISVFNCKLILFSSAMFTLVATKKLNIRLPYPEKPHVENYQIYSRSVIGM